MTHAPLVLNHLSVRATAESCSAALQLRGASGAGARKPAHPVLIMCILFLLALASGPLDAQQTERISPHQSPSQQPNQPHPPSPTALAEDNESGTELKTVSGIAGNVNSDPVSEVSIVLQGSATMHPRMVITDDRFYETSNLQPGVPYDLIVVPAGFAGWASPFVDVKPGQHGAFAESKLHGKQVQATTVVSFQTSAKPVSGPVKASTKQRGFGFMPNSSFTVYGSNPALLSPKLKFRLSFKDATDPLAFVGAAVFASMGQSGKKPYYGDGWEGFGERFGANYANQFTDVMISGAVLPSLLHQDPRYFYRGKGTVKSRISHAIFAVFVAKGDNGRGQPNYSSLGGDLASAAISNAYYPPANRGVGPTFANFGIKTAVHMGNRLLQEFVFRPPR